MTASIVSLRDAACFVCFSLLTSAAPAQAIPAPGAAGFERIVTRDLDHRILAQNIAGEAESNPPAQPPDETLTVRPSHPQQGDAAEAPAAPPGSSGPASVSAPGREDPAPIATERRMPSDQPRALWEALAIIAMFAAIACVAGRSEFLRSRLKREHAGLSSQYDGLIRQYDNLNRQYEDLAGRRNSEGEVARSAETPQVTADERARNGNAADAVAAEEQAASPLRIVKATSHLIVATGPDGPKRNTPPHRCDGDAGTTQVDAPLYGDIDPTELDAMVESALRQATSVPDQAHDSTAADQMEVVRLTRAQLRGIIENAARLGRARAEASAPARANPAGGAGSAAALRQKDAEIDAEIRRLHDAKSRAERAAQASVDEIAALTSAKQRFLEQVNAERRVSAEQRSELVRAHEQAIGARLAEIATLRTRVQSRDADLSSLRAAQEQNEALLTSLRKELAGKDGELADLRLDRNAKDVQIEELRALGETLTADKASLRAEIETIQMSLAPDYCRGSAREAFDQLRIDAASSGYAATAAAYLGVIRSFPLPSGQKAPSALLDAFAEFARQLVQYRRHSGDSEEAIAGYLKVWAKIINTEDRTGVAITVPVIGSGLDQTWMTYAFGSEVTTLRSWCVRLNGVVAKKAEVNFR